MSKNPCVYLKLPHYLASWLRNVDHDKPLPTGAPVVIEQGTRLKRIFDLTAMPNLDNTVQPRCLSQKQWEQMQKGHMLVSKSGDLRMSVSRPVRKPLQMHEILHSLDCDAEILYDSRTGKPEPDNVYFDVYMPFQMPDTVVRNERECRVQSDWYLPDPKPIFNELMSRYKLSLVKFIIEKRAATLQLGFVQAHVQILQSFMDWYGIRPGEKELLQLRQMVRRMHERHQLSLGPSVANTEPSTGILGIPVQADSFDLQCQYECTSPTDKPFTLADVPPVNRPRKVFCPETGVTYTSLRSAAKALNVPDSNVRNAVINGNPTCSRDGRELHFYSDSELSRPVKRKKHKTKTTTVPDVSPSAAN